MVVTNFTEVVNKAVNKGTITEEEIRLEFGITKPTFQKWLEGKNGPHKAMQKLIFKYIYRGETMLIFLDIDGVLLHGGCKNHKDIDPDCVAVLKRFCDKHKAKIVVSSAWRIGKTIEELDFILHSYGLDKGTVIGKTDYETTRGKEILDWIKNNKHKGKYAVIDDEIFDLGPIPSKNVIHIIDGWNRKGLQQHHIDAYEKRL